MLIFHVSHPANPFIREQGDKGIIKISEFGL
jgi:hypothetical protein